MTTMYDATHQLVGNIPQDAKQVAGYNDGASWCQWTAADWARFPNAEKVHITVVGNNSDLDADVADCERGDFTPQTAAAWARAKIDAGKGRPTIYCGDSDYNALVGELAKVGLAWGRDVDWWEANWDNDAVISSKPGAVAHQYQSTPQYDLSITNGNWPKPPPPTIQTTYYPEDTVKATELTLPIALDASGNGAYDGASLGVDTNKLVSVTWIVEVPGQVGRYDHVPTGWAIDSTGQFVVEGGSPGARYGCILWEAA